VASGLGLAFLYRETGDKKYLLRAEKVYRDYMKIRRTDEGGVSHLSLWTELWDDTVYMIGEYLLAMYQATGDEKYLEEFAKQVRIHRGKLQDKQTGLWYHGWDSDDKDHCMFCSQAHWPDRTTRLSHEKWGRGNGWIVVTLSDALDVILNRRLCGVRWPAISERDRLHLPGLSGQENRALVSATRGHGDPDNYIESSCTAMFGYGIANALRHKVVSDTVYDQSIRMACQGLRQYSMSPIGNSYLTPTNVCTGTCIGDKNYYFKRVRQKGETIRCRNVHTVLYGIYEEAAAALTGGLTRLFLTDE
jgi:unsaturated rhamnogalacturonyl hydrolase